MRLALDEFLAQQEGGKILFLGREELFTHKESQRFLKKYAIELTTILDDSVIAVIEHHRLNPVEEDISYEAYDRKLPLYKLEEFERLLSHFMEDDQVLMSLKLSNDQKRIYTLINNSHISDQLFIKLIEIYKWSQDEEEDNNEDRGVVIATLRRFLEYKPNEEDLLYSPLTLKKLIGESEDPDLLYALLSFPNYKFMQKGKQWIRLREVIATNLAIDDRGIQKLLRFRNKKIDFYLAANRSLPIEILESFLERESQEIDEALASNSSIGDDIFKQLLSRAKSVQQILLAYQSIDSDRLKLIEESAVAEEIYPLLGQNPKLSKAVIAKLLRDDNAQVVAQLSSNISLSAQDIRHLFQTKSKEIYRSLGANSSTPRDILETLFESYQEESEILQSLASNINTPIEILTQLFERDIYVINEQLAANPSTPLKLLNILKIDTRLRNALTINKTFTDNITRELGL